MYLSVFKSQGRELPGDLRSFKPLLPSFRKCPWINPAGWEWKSITAGPRQNALYFLFFPISSNFYYYYYLFMYPFFFCFIEASIRRLSSTRTYQQTRKKGKRENRKKQNSNKRLVESFIRLTSPSIWRELCCGTWWRKNCRRRWELLLNAYWISFANIDIRCLFRKIEPVCILILSNLKWLNARWLDCLVGAYGLPMLLVTLFLITLPYFQLIEIQLSGSCLVLVRDSSAISADSLRWFSIDSSRFY